MIVELANSAWGKFRKTFGKDEYFVFWTSLLFYFLLYFNLNNKTLLGLFFVFLLIFWNKLKNLPITLFVMYLLFLPFEKGKSFSFVVIPTWILGTELPYTFGFTITFADLAFFGLLGLFFREEILNRWMIKKLKLKKGDIFLFLFLFFVFVSIFFSQFQIISFLAFLKLMRIVAIYFLVQKLLLGSRARDLIPFALASSVIFEGGWTSLQFLFQRPLGKAIEHISGPFSAYGHAAVEERAFFRAQGTFDHPNTLGSFLVILLSFFLVYIFTKGVPKVKKKIFLGSLLAGFLGLVFSASRASWGVMTVIVTGTVFFLKYQGKLSRIVVNKKRLILTVLLFVFLIAFIIFPRLSHLYLTLAEKGGVYYRSYLLEKAWILAQDAPFGIGMATFPAVLISKFGFFSWPAPVHNLFLEIFVETGIFSLVSFLLFLILAYKRFFLSLKRLKTPSEFFFKSGAFFASLGFLGVAQFYPFFWSSNIFEYFWLLLGMMLYNI